MALGPRPPFIRKVEWKEVSFPNFVLHSLSSSWDG